MLKFYLSSVLIWSIILICEMLIFKNAIYRNGWLDNLKSKEPSVARFIATIISYLACAAIPVFRFFMAIFIFVLAAVSQERLNEMVEEIKNEKINNDNPEE